MNKTSRFLKDTGGSITALTAVALIAFVGVLAFVVDLGHLHIVQNELRNAADTCALRGARAFLPDTVTGMTAIPPDRLNAENQASLAVQLNKSDNAYLKDLPIGDIQTGLWYCDSNPPELLAWQWPIPASYWGKHIGPAVSLPTKRKDAYNDGPVAMSLATFLGQGPVDVGAKATAMLTPMGGPVPGSPTLPFGTWSDQLTGVNQEITGVFRNDNSDNLGWTNLDPNDTNPNASELKKMISDATGKYTPDCPTGSTVGIQNGVAASVIKAMVAEGNRFGLTVSSTDPGTYVPTGTNSAGVAYADVIYMMPVFDDNGSGDKFNQSAVVGAVPVKIEQVTDSPENSIRVKVVEAYFTAPGYGGGAWYGILSTQPKLVE
jgi:hypothetical protein